jgi:hypothetical protein
MRSATRRQSAARVPGPDAGAVVARLMRVIDPAFLAEAGWDPGSGCSRCHLGTRCWAGGRARRQDAGTCCMAVTLSAGSAGAPAPGAFRSWPAMTCRAGIVRRCSWCPRLLTACARWRRAGGSRWPGGTAALITGACWAAVRSVVRRSGVAGHRAGDRGSRAGQLARREPAGRRGSAVWPPGAHARRCGHRPGGAAAGRLGASADERGEP